MKFRSNNQEESIDFIKKFAKDLTIPSLILLKGEMGTGKTFFSKVLAKELGSQDLTSSPTFSIVNKYNSPKGNVYHLDLYRLEEPDELYAIGFDDILNEQAVILVEWPEIAELDALADYIIEIETTGDSQREFNIVKEPVETK